MCEAVCTLALRVDHHDGRSLRLIARTKLSACQPPAFRSGLRRRSITCGPNDALRLAALQLGLPSLWGSNQSARLLSRGPSANSDDSISASLPRAPPRPSSKLCSWSVLTFQGCKKHMSCTLLSCSVRILYSNKLQCAAGSAGYMHHPFFPHMQVPVGRGRSTRASKPAEESYDSVSHRRNFSFLFIRQQCLNTSVQGDLCSA